jgi:plastocyanin
VKQTKSFHILGAAVVAALALAGCGGGGGTSDQSITVQALDTFKFDPASLSAQVGQTVNVTLNNTGVLEHNFVIDEFSVSAGPIIGGQTADVSFTPSTAGSYTYYCNVPGHREAGMEGTLTVTE